MSNANMTNRTSNSVGNPTSERYLPGAVISVGTHRVEIVSYLAEGGFAQIYVVKFLEYLNEFESKPKVSLKAGDVACLKRVLVQDENGLSEMRNEVEVMKQLMGASNIVQYYDSNACRRPNGNTGFEVLLLMELCPNRSLLDYMNQRLATKLNEKEILKIMYDVSLAVSHMHYLNKPLIHRDIKIENVLVDAQSNFKLCDFGSTSQCFPVVTTHQEIAILTQNIYVHTTPQYRCPEMIDLYRCLPINEKSDIWALGIFLYKLLFFTTPFELTGQFAILHSKYEFPQNHFSSRLINLIIIMLAENPYVRPNVYQVLHHVCTMMGVDVPIEDKYGSGAYNFDKYAEFQTKLQTTQYQMYMLQQKKLEGNGILSPSEESTLNNLMITAFEVSSKIPMEADSREPSRSPDIQDLKLAENVGDASGLKNDRSLASSSDELSVKQTHSSISQEKEKSQVDVAENTLEIEPEEPDGTTEIVKSAVPADLAKVNKPEPEKTIATTAPQVQDDLSRTFSNVEQRQKSSSSVSSGNKSYMSGSRRLSSEDLTDYIAKSEIAAGTKQHKSNNPFPRMTSEYTDTTHKENFFSNENPRNPSNNQQRLQFPQNEVQYKAERDRMPLQQGSQFASPPSQRQPMPQVQQYAYRAEIPTAVQQQQYQASFGQEFSGYINQNMRYPYQAMPSNANVPYYPAQRMTQQPSQPQKAMYPASSEQPISNSLQQPSQVKGQGPSRILPVPNNVSTLAEEGIPPPMPPRREKSAKDDSSSLTNRQKKEEELLIAFSPPKQHEDQNTKASDVNIQPSPSKRGNLDLTYNEMDLSREDLMKDNQSQTEMDMGDMESSIASSESIELNLEDSKRGRRSLRVNGTDFPRGYDSPIPRRRGGERDKSTTDDPETDIEKETPRRRSLDLKFHEVRFSSPDLKSQNPLLNNKQHGGHKHRVHLHKQRNKEVTEPAPQTARRNHSTGSSGNASRKQSSHQMNSSKTGPQNKSDGLQKMKTSNGSSSNSSLNSSSTSLSGMRRSFAKARQSLDLERVRREALNNSESSVASGGKRRSLFSVFRGSSDKK